MRDPEGGMEERLIDETEKKRRKMVREGERGGVREGPTEAP